MNSGLIFYGTIYNDFIKTGYWDQLQNIGKDNPYIPLQEAAQPKDATPASIPVINEVNKQLALCNTYLLDLDKALDRKDFLCGSQISLADISIGVFMYRLVEMGLGVKLPKNTSRWYDKMAESKGYRKWVMSDFSELAGRVIN